ncbi:MAG: NACHT domain-containing protein [Pseudonocardiaceae bacterium]
MTAFGLLFLASCVVLMGIFTVRGSQGNAARVAQVVGVVLPISASAVSLVVWWRRETVPTALTASQLDEARKTLAVVVAERWRQESLAWSLGYPEPMPVCWGLTQPIMMDHPELIAVGGLSFTGRSDHISALAAEFRRLRRRRLVILGDPGSGKTTLAVQLLRELLATRQPGEPIPVLVSLAGWDPTEQPRLHTWLAARLAEDYPSLSTFGPTTAQALAEQGHLLPILDGLDELPEPRRPEVIAALNKSLTDTDQLVLTSRTTEYKEAITEAGDVLTSAAVIAPEPLTAAQAAEYLTHCLPPDPGPSWGELLHRLRTGTAGHLAPVLATPLGLWLLRTVYIITPRADPTPLLTPGTTPVQADLFDQLIPAVLTTRPASRHHGDTFRPRHTWNPHDVRSWLTYLAHPPHHTDIRNLHWWHLARHTLTPRAVKLALGLMVGLPFGLVAALTFGLTLGLAVGLAGGLTFGLTLGLTFGLMVEPTARRWLTDEPAYANLQVTRRFTLLTRRLAFGLMVALMVALVGGLTVGLVVGLGTGLKGGLALGLTGGLALGLTEWVGIPNRTDWATTPRSTYQATCALTVLQLCLAVLGTGLAIGLTGWLTADLAIGLAGGLVAGLVAGLVGGLVGGLAARRAGRLVIRSGAWLSYVLAICWLAASGKLPLRLMGFLDDAYRLGLLRTVGPAYQFRHAEFQDHLIRTADTRTTTD